MTADAVTVDARDAFKGATMEISVRVRKTWRFWLGLWLLGVAARLIGCEGVEIRQPDGAAFSHPEG